MGRGQLARQSRILVAAMKRSKPIVAIDGPAGSGKTTVSRLAAQQLGYVVLDTGALYRTLALATSRANLDPGQDDLGAFCEALVQRGAIRLGATPEGGSQVWLDGEDVSLAIRTPEMSARASVVSAIPAVRAALLSLQRSIGGTGGVVVEGRDIGSIVFPDAEAKFFLTATLERRAERRFSELAQGSDPPSLNAVLDQVVQRDRRDSERSVAPLLRAPDAELLDSTSLGIEEVVARIVAVVRRIEADLAAAVRGSQ
jgi:cytidylate kinase